MAKTPKRKRGKLRRSKSRAKSRPAQRKRIKRRRSKSRAAPRPVQRKRKGESRAKRKERKRVEKLEQKVRMQAEIIRDLAQRRVTRFEREDDEDEMEDGVFSVPDGAIITHRDDDGDPDAFELPPMLDEFSDDYDDFDWDDFLDDFGDLDDADPYGEDAA